MWAPRTSLPNLGQGLVGDARFHDRRRYGLAMGVRHRQPLHVGANALPRTPLRRDHHHRHSHAVLLQTTHGVGRDLRGRERDE